MVLVYASYNFVIHACMSHSNNGNNNHFCERKASWIAKRTYYFINETMQCNECSKGSKVCLVPNNIVRLRMM